jgi:hypothetical protein
MRLMPLRHPRPLDTSVSQVPPGWTGARRGSSSGSLRATWQ